MDTCNKINNLAIKNNIALRIIGIPKTIDNDLALTDHCPGYGSAARYAAFAAAELAMDAASLPIHVVVLEMMGRNAGWITAATALFKKIMPCEHLIYLPELPFDKSRFLTDVRSAFSKKQGLLVTVSEGVKDADGNPLTASSVRDGFGHLIPGGAAQSLADLIIAETPFKARAEKPGLLGRVSMAHQSAIDREESFQAGAFAVCSAVEGKSGFMVAIDAERNGGYRASLKLVPLADVANVEKTFPLEWIKPEGNGIEAPFSEYCLPLIGAAAPEYTSILEVRL